MASEPKRPKRGGEEEEEEDWHITSQLLLDLEDSPEDPPPPPVPDPKEGDKGKVFPCPNIRLNPFAHLDSEERARLEESEYAPPPPPRPGDSVSPAPSGGKEWLFLEPPSHSMSTPDPSAVSPGSGEFLESDSNAEELPKGQVYPDFFQWSQPGVMDTLPVEPPVDHEEEEEEVWTDAQPRDEEEEAGYVFPEVGRAASPLPEGTPTVCGIPLRLIAVSSMLPYGAEIGDRDRPVKFDPVRAVHAFESIAQAWIERDDADEPLLSNIAETLYESPEPVLTVVSERDVRHAAAELPWEDTPGLSPPIGEAGDTSRLLSFGHAVPGARAALFRRISRLRAIALICKLYDRESPPQSQEDLVLWNNTVIDTLREHWMWPPENARWRQDMRLVHFLYSVSVAFPTSRFEAMVDQLAELAPTYEHDLGF